MTQKIQQLSSNSSTDLGNIKTRYYDFDLSVLNPDANLSVTLYNSELAEIGSFSLSGKGHVTGENVNLGRIVLSDSTTYNITFYTNVKTFTGANCQLNSHITILNDNDDVNVTNPSINVAGNVDATVNGSVSISGTPNVNVTSGSVDANVSGSVSINGTPAVTVSSGTVDINAGTVTLDGYNSDASSDAVSSTTTANGEYTIKIQPAAGKKMILNGIWLFADIQNSGNGSTAANSTYRLALRLYNSFATSALYEMVFVITSSALTFGQTCGLTVTADDIATSQPNFNITNSTWTGTSFNQKQSAYFELRNPIVLDPNWYMQFDVQPSGSSNYSLKYYIQTRGIIEPL